MNREKESHWANATCKLNPHEPDNRPVRREASLETDQMQAIDRMAPFRTASRKTRGLESEERYPWIVSA